MGRIYFGGPAGKVEYFDAGSKTWNDLSAPTAYTVTAIHGTGPNDIWIGCSGFWGIPVETWHYDGSAWTKHEINLGASGYGNVVSLWALSPTEVYATATASNYTALWRWNGTSWSALHVHASSWWRFDHVQALSSTEVYVWGMAQSAYPNLAWGIWKWDGSTLTQEPTEISGVSGTYIDAFTAVDSDTLYAVPRDTPSSSVGEVIYKGKFGGPWSVDHDFSGEGDSNGFFYGSGMISHSSGYVYGVTSTGGAQPFRQRILSGGSWSTAEITGIDPGLGLPIAEGCEASDGGAVRSIICFSAGNDTLIYQDAAWTAYDRLSGYRFYGSWASFDSTAPVIDTNSPIGMTTDRNATVSFSTKDVGGGVVLATIDCTVGGESAVVDGVFQPGWRGPLSSITPNALGGYDVIVDKETTFGAYVLVTVTASCADADGNPASLTWTFKVDATSAAEEDQEPIMIEIALDDSHDVYLDATGDLALIAGVDAVKQLLLVGLRLFRGEWYLAEEQDGVPYYQNVLVNAPKSRVIEAMFRQQILASPGIERLKSFSMTIDRGARELSAEFEAVSVEGEVAIAEVFP